MAREVHPECFHMAQTDKPTACLVYMNDNCPSIDYKLCQNSTLHSNCKQPGVFLHWKRDNIIYAQKVGKHGCAIDNIFKSLNLKKGNLSVMMSSGAPILQFPVRTLDSVILLDINLG